MKHPQHIASPIEEPTEVASPCLNVCTLDAAGQVCLGCLRSLEEIAQWGRLANAERAQLVAELAARRRRMEELSVVTATQPCPDCGAQFPCGANDPQQPCWCTRLPPVAPRAGQTCLCPECLAAAAA